jgi:hypothetical protein
MKRRIRKLLCLLLAVSFALPQFAGCDGLPLASPTPQATATQAPTDAPQTSAASGTPSASPSLSPAESPAASPTESPSPSPATATPTESPTASPSPTPSPSHAGDRADVKVLQYYDGIIPEGLKIDLKYEKYAAYVDYFVVLKSSTVKELPDANAKTLKKVAYSNRLEMLAKVQGADGKSVWYRVRISGSIGYIAESAGSPRAFQLQKAFDYVLRLQEVADQPDTVRISDYNNKPRGGKKVLSPKLPGGKTVDPYGIARDQAAPAYLAPTLSASFRYMPDGMLCQSLGAVGDMTAVYVPYWDEVRYVPTIYIETKEVDKKTADVIKTLTQAVVVDRANQNITTFEYRGGQWYILSMCFVSTGKKGGYAQPTPLGAYFTDRRPAGTKGIAEFWYFADGADEDDPKTKFEGYAPWGVRFCEGAYLHGLPVSVSYDENDELIFTGRTYESASFLGVSPQSHMCVRNYTSHAKFVYQWIKDGQATVIVIE